MLDYSKINFLATFLLRGEKSTSLAKYKGDVLTPRQFPPIPRSVSLRKVKFCRNPETTADTFVIINIKKSQQKCTKKDFKKVKFCRNPETTADTFVIIEQVVIFLINYKK